MISEQAESETLTKQYDQLLDSYHQKPAIQPNNFHNQKTLDIQNTFVNATQLPSISNLNLQWQFSGQPRLIAIWKATSLRDRYRKSHWHVATNIHIADFASSWIAHRHLPKNDTRFSECQVQNSISRSDRDLGIRDTIMNSFIFTDFLQVSRFAGALLSKTKPRKASPCLHAMWWSDKYSNVPPAPSAQSVSWTSQPPIPGTEQQV